MSSEGGELNPQPAEHRSLRRWPPPAALSRQRLLLVGLLLVLAILTFWTILRQNPYAVDWHFTYRPAALTMLRGQNPYTSGDVLPFGPPWTVIPLIPFAILPEPIGRSLFAVASIGLFAYIAIRMRAKPLGVLAFLLCVPVTSGLQSGNIEALVLLASPFLSPYTIVTSWAGAILALAPSTLEIAAASTGTWIFWALFYLMQR